MGGDSFADLRPDCIGALTARSAELENISEIGKWTTPLVLSFSAATEIETFGTAWTESDQVRKTSGDDLGTSIRGRDVRARGSTRKGNIISAERMLHETLINIETRAKWQHCRRLHAVILGRTNPFLPGC